MKRLTQSAFLFALAFAPTVALTRGHATAEIAIPPPFAPITLEQPDFDRLRAWLLKQPTEFGMPVILWLDDQEARARAKAQERVQEKVPEKVPEKAAAEKSTSE
jgi:hypothetical protein